MYTQLILIKFPRIFCSRYFIILKAKKGLELVDGENE
jgi:hypothetical protein